MNKIKNLITKMLGKKLSNKLKIILDKYTIKIYAQDGEDIILKEYLSGKENGFYVDIGAHHPMRFSNTHLFYKKGWKGINIDAMPGSMKLFNKIRKRDVNLEIGISEKEDISTYYMFNEPGLNGFSKELSIERDSDKNYKIIGKKEIKTFPLSIILDKYLQKNQKIDFMNIDVEGLDLQVLKSNNWDKYKPEFVLVEITNTDLNKIQKDPTYIYLTEKGYKLVAKTYRTCIFKRVIK